MFFRVAKSAVQTLNQPIYRLAKSNFGNVVGSTRNIRSFLPELIRQNNQIDTSIQEILRIKNIKLKKVTPSDSTEGCILSSSINLSANWGKTSDGSKEAAGHGFVGILWNILHKFLVNQSTREKLLPLLQTKPAFNNNDNSTIDDSLTRMRMDIISYALQKTPLINPINAIQAEDIKQKMQELLDKIYDKLTDMNRRLSANLESKKKKNNESSMKFQRDEPNIAKHSPMAMKTRQPIKGTAASVEMKNQPSKGKTFSMKFKKDQLAKGKAASMKFKKGQPANEKATVIKLSQDPKNREKSTIIKLIQDQKNKQKAPPVIKLKQDSKKKDEIISKPRRSKESSIRVKIDQLKKEKEKLMKLKKDRVMKQKEELIKLRRDVPSKQKSSTKLKQDHKRTNEEIMKLIKDKESAMKLRKDVIKKEAEMKEAKRLKQAKSAKRKTSFAVEKDEAKKIKESIKLMQDQAKEEKKR